MLLYICLMLIFLLLLKKCFYKMKQWQELRVKINKFPGRNGLPIVGNLFDWYGDRRMKFWLLTDYIQEFIKRGICRGWMINYPVVLVMDPKEIEVVLSSTTHIRKSRTYAPLIPWLGTGLLTSTGSKWRHRRKMLTPAFHFSILQEYLKVFSSESKNLVRVLEKHVNEEFDIVKTLSQSTLNIICVYCLMKKTSIILLKNEKYRLNFITIPLLPVSTYVTTYHIVRNSERRRAFNAEFVSNADYQIKLDKVERHVYWTGTAMGTPLESLEGSSNYHKCIHDMGEISIERVIKTWSMLDILYFFTPTYWRQKRILKYLHTFSSNIIQRRKRGFLDCLERQKETYSEKRKLAMLDILLLAQKEEGNIDDEGIREEVDTFMFEGHDTTMICLIYTLMLLANNKTHQDKIYDEILSVFGEEKNDPTYFQLQELKYMEMCIKESLRLYPSVGFFSREPYSDITTKSGDVIPADCICMITVYNLHRNPDIYKNPELFDPHRFLPENNDQRHPFAYIPFSAGPRNCIGQKFAMLELKCVITEILRNFILEPVDTPETIEILLDIVLRPAGPVKVKFIPRNI